MAKERRKERRGDHREPKDFEEYMLQLDRVTRVVKGGRRMRFRATVIIGDRAGRVGLGIGKGNDVQISVRKAVNDAKKTLITIPIVNDTIPHETKIKYKAARVLIMPASPGTGIIAGGAVRKIIELAGVKNILSKSFGTSNRLVVGQATMRLLKQLRLTEAAKKFLAQLKKESDDKKRKLAEERAQGERAGSNKPRRGSDRQERVLVETETAKVSELQEAALKVAETKGRLEQEADAKK